ncbi:MAG: Hsp33 family molecular chaperone [Alphaproteobacteria bacterium]|nr:Hsp33 family molecular chaperone [Alphaproteobacteria bacterium]
MSEATQDPLGEHDDIVAGFQVEGRAVRGRIIRLGPVIDQILSAHDYPEPVARMLGEAIMIAALIGNALKFEGRLIVQANGKGPMAFVVAEYVTGEGVRGYAKIDREAFEQAAAARAEGTSWVQTLLGDGMLALTIDQGDKMDRYQGVVPLEGETLAACAETYFQQSEQTPTRLRVAVGEEWDAQGRRWRAGGALLQAVAGDETRGSVDEDWEHCRVLFDTLEDSELLDSDLSAGALLYRLFNEDGVRIFEPTSLQRRCACDHERLKRIIASFSEDDQAHMVRDGEVVMTCEYCNRDWRFSEEEVKAVRS